MPPTQHSFIVYAALILQPTQSVFLPFAAKP